MNLLIVLTIILITIDLITGQLQSLDSGGGAGVDRIQNEKFAELTALTNEKVLKSKKRYVEKGRVRKNTGELLQRAASLQNPIFEREDDDDEYLSRRRARFMFKQRVGK